MGAEPFQARSCVWEMVGLLRLRQGGGKKGLVGRPQSCPSLNPCVRVSAYVGLAHMFGPGHNLGDSRFSIVK